MLTFVLLILLPTLMNADAPALSPCELVHEGYKTYHCSELDTEKWHADVHNASPESCLAQCEQHSTCTHVSFHLDDNQAYCQLQDCTGSSGFSWSSSGEDYLYHEYSCFSTYQCRPVELANGAEPEVVPYPADITDGCHGLELSDQATCANFDKDNCFWLKEKCYWVQDGCTMVNLGAEAKETCEKTPAGSIAVFFICFFAAGCIGAILVFNCPDFVETVLDDMVAAAQKIIGTLFSVLSAAWGLFEGINVSVVLGCLKDSVEMGGSCSEALGLLESGTITLVLFSSLSMLLILVFACGMMWFGLKVNDDLKLGLYFVHFFELGVLVGCAIGLSANPDDCSPEFGSILEDQKTAFIKVVVFTVLYMVYDCMSFLGLTAYISNLLDFSSEEAEDDAEEAKNQENCSADVDGAEFVVKFEAVELEPSKAEPVEIFEGAEHY